MSSKLSAQYYGTHGLDFQCLDHEETLMEADGRLSDPGCRNFVVDFGADNAWIGWNLDGHANAVKESWTEINQVSHDGEAGEQ
ncbi:hypothetical protein ABW19_dt0200205 [Dactylella cylindrospora]|nr:hypothetical protein ABW19_dt0200205 [Dactylella cylindrospora]